MIKYCLILSEHGIIFRYCQTLWELGSLVCDCRFPNTVSLLVLLDNSHSILFTNPHPHLAFLFFCFTTQLTLTLTLAINFSPDLFLARSFRQLSLRPSQTLSLFRASKAARYTRKLFLFLAKVKIVLHQQLWEMVKWMWTWISI